MYLVCVSLLALVHSDCGSRHLFSHHIALQDGALEQVDTDLVDAARTLGMSETSIFFKVLVPNALPGIISGVYYHLREV